MQRLEGQGSIFGLQELEDIQGLGKNRDMVEPL
jgi:hypothetical protein